jgi:hypothetical protein
MNLSTSSGDGVPNFIGLVKGVKTWDHERVRHH